MTKERTGPGFRILHLFTYHPWLKFISLVLAILVWIYVRDKIGRFNY